MTSLQQRRLILIITLILGISLTVGLILYALSQNINIFYTPTQIAEQTLSPHKKIRIGGMVVKNSVQRKEGLAVEFVITDFKSQIKVSYQGILPDLFREGQGIVAMGYLNGQQDFVATE